jgi:hypothetical protein
VNLEVHFGLVPNARSTSTFLFSLVATSGLQQGGSGPEPVEKPGKNVIKTP